MIGFYFATSGALLFAAQIACAELVGFIRQQSAEIEDVLGTANKVFPPMKNDFYEGVI